MAKIGLNNFWYSHLTEALDGTPTYDGASNLGKAVNCNVSITNNSAELYADDALAESDTTFQSGTVTLGVDDDRETTFADLLGHSVSDEGEVVANSNDIAPWVGIARILVKMVNNVRIYKVIILNKVKFSEPSDDENTKGESVEFTTPSIEGKVATLSNGDWKISKVFTTKAEALAYIQSYFENPTPPTETYTVSYNANGGSGEVASQTVEAGSSITVASGSSLTPPSDKVFSGWDTNAEATEASIEAGSTYTPAADVTLYAIYTPNA